MKKRNIGLIIFALAGWGLYAFDDTLSFIIYDMAKGGLTADRLIQLGTFSSVTFIAIKAERVLLLFRRFKVELSTETKAEIAEIRAETKAEIAEVSTETKAEIEKVRAENLEVANKMQRETSEVIGNLSGKLHSERKELNKLKDTAEAQKISQEAFLAEVESVKGLFLSTMKYIIEHSLMNQQEQQNSKS